MQKIISLYKRDHEGTRQIYDEVVEGAEWVLAGEGVPTIKTDGTACLMQDGHLSKRFDRKLKDGKYKDAPEAWVAAEEKPNEHTGHWPGWLPVGDGPEDKWHRSALRDVPLSDGTYELVGPKVQGNPYKLTQHELWRHGVGEINWKPLDTFASIRDFLGNSAIEGIVWHHSDGRMVKIKRRDFGLPWPIAVKGEYGTY